MWQYKNDFSSLSNLTNQVSFLLGLNILHTSDMVLYVLDMVLHLLFQKLIGGVRGHVVKIVDLLFAPYHCGFESRQGLCILSCESAIQLAYGTSVVLFRCQFMPEIMHLRSTSTSKAGTSPYDLYCVSMI
jgi:hypothetical protein